MQIPGGQIAHRYGAKYLLFVALIINGFLALLIPWAARVVILTFYENIYLNFYNSQQLLVHIVTKKSNYILYTNICF